MAQDTQKPTNGTQTLPITNFGGRLTRVLNGELNSGLAKFVPSFGYDPFSKPMNLTWLEQPVDITGGAITDLVLAAKQRFESGVLYIYAIGSSGNLYKIQPNSITNPNIDSVIGIASVLNGASYSFGASIDFFGQTEKIYVGHDNGVNSINFDGTSEAKIGTTANYMANRYRPIMQFIGSLVFGNGSNIGLIGPTGTVTSPLFGSGASSFYGQLSPTLPPETYITDIDLSPDGNYLYLTTSGIPNENIITVSNDRQAASASNGQIDYWNGSDTGITATKTIPSYAVTALQTYLDNNMFFSNDSFGSSINNGTAKMVSLPNNKAPYSNAVTVNGNFLSWVNPELNSAGNGLNASMYYYGNLDDENPPGLWRVARYFTTLATGFIYQTPLNIMTNNKYSTVNNAINAIVTLGYGKHYFSVFDVNANTNKYTLQRFLITPSGTGTPQLGVYETQTQLFSKRITIKQIRIYTEPTAANNGFQIDCIGSDGNVITNGTFNYTFAAGTDITKVQGSLERINFNPAALNLYALGLRITNTGTVNMTIKKIEVDYNFSGK